MSLGTPAVSAYGQSMSDESYPASVPDEDRPERFEAGDAGTDQVNEQQLADEADADDGKGDSDVTEFGGDSTD